MIITDNVSRSREGNELYIAGFRIISGIISWASWKKAYRWVRIAQAAVY